jgi:hypothetical protein
LAQSTFSKSWTLNPIWQYLSFTLACDIHYP